MTRSSSHPYRAEIQIQNLFLLATLVGVLPTKRDDLTKEGEGVAIHTRTGATVILGAVELRDVRLEG